MPNSWPYPQTLDYSGKACQGQTLWLTITLVNLGCKNYYMIVTWCSSNVSPISLDHRSLLSVLYRSVEFQSFSMVSCRACNTRAGLGSIAWVSTFLKKEFKIKCLPCKYPPPSFNQSPLMYFIMQSPPKLWDTFTIVSCRILYSFGNPALKD
jgi:hypothetical protein